jgi:two-component system heavy metal sensor histidine kinase CusS
MRHFRTLRGRLSALALLVATVAIAVLTIAFNAVLDKSLDSDANGRLRSQAAAAATTVISDHGRLRVRESPDDEAIDGSVWVYQGRHAVLRPPGDAEVQRAADALAEQRGKLVELPDRELRLYAAPVTPAGGVRGTVVAGLSFAPYERTTNVALIGSLALALVLLGAVGAVTWVTIGRALAPVAEMTRSADEWSAHELDRRFGSQARPDELGRLAATFDRLLDRVAASLRHEQRLSAELSHELRTPLARITAELDLLRRRQRSPEEAEEAYQAVQRSAEQMTRIVDTLMAAARADAGLDRGRCTVADGVERAAATWRAPLAERGIELVIEPPPASTAPVIGVEAETFERMVAPLLDNARRFASARVTIAAATDGGRVVVSVSDDGPGMSGEEAETAFDPGVSHGKNGHRGAGLGLALARRLARASGGDLTLAPGRPGAGAEFRLELPS